MLVFHLAPVLFAELHLYMCERSNRTLHLDATNCMAPYSMLQEKKNPYRLYLSEFAALIHQLPADDSLCTRKSILISLRIGEKEFPTPMAIIYSVAE